MSTLRVQSFAISLDGYGAGPNQDLRNPLGVRRLELMEWFFHTRAWRRMHGQDDGETGVDNAIAEQGFSGIGACIICAGARDPSGFTSGDSPMKTLLMNLLALLIGVAVGGSVNMGFVVLGQSLIPPPAGVDVTNAESFRAAIHFFEPRHFVMPFAAHALGTLAGALAGCLLSATHRTAISYGIGAVFLLGGIAASFMITTPVWFVVLDLVVAYIPMAWLGLTIGKRIKPGPANA